MVSTQVGTILYLLRDLERGTEPALALDATNKAGLWDSAHGASFSESIPLFDSIYIYFLCHDDLSGHRGSHVVLISLLIS